MGYAGQIKTSGGVLNPIASSLYGVCSTRANEAGKIVSMPNFDTLLTGVMIQVKFTNSNSAANPTLTVNSIGPYPIYAFGTTAPGNTSAQSWAANSLVSFTFDGTAWRMNDVGANAAIIALLEGEIASEAATREASDATLLSRIAPVYNEELTYRLNDLVTYNGQLYRATVDITAPEAWTSAHWAATTVATEREYKLVFHDTVVGVASTVIATVSGTGVTSASVNKSQWEAIITTTGNYVFSYTGTDWMLNEGIVIPSNYGVTIEGTPVSGDTVTVTYTAGRAAFVYTNTYPEFPFRAIVPLEGVKATMIPLVTYGLTEAISGMYAPIANTFDGGIHLYATNEPTGPITVPTIVCWG